MGMAKTEIYIACSCGHKRGCGSFAYKALSVHEEILDTWFFPYTSENKLAIESVVLALSKIPTGSSVTIFSQSKFAIRGAVRFLEEWSNKNTWPSTLDGESDLWKKFSEMTAKRSVSWVWVDGSGNKEISKLKEISKKVLDAGRIRMLPKINNTETRKGRGVIPLDLYRENYDN